MQIHALHLDLQLTAGTGPGHVTRGQTAAHRQHHGIGQGRLVNALGAALLALVAQPQLPLALPLAVRFLGMHRQQCIGAIALGGLTQGGRIAAVDLLGVGQ
ncbi:hypothetical protein D3C71_1642400 [compost metagenome]